jgi:hypothetical protein
MLLRRGRLPLFAAVLAASAILFAVAGSLGGLGPAEEATVLVVTLPVSLALYRALGTLVTRGGAPLRVLAPGSQRRASSSSVS